MSLEVACVMTAAEAGGLASKPDIIVFPERVSFGELTRAEKAHPAAIIVGATLENRLWHSRPRCCGHLRQGRRNRLDYLKIGTDDISDGVRKWPRRPTFETETVCIGVIICMDLDVDRETFRAHVVDQVRKSSRPYKLICVPAAMHNDWFRGTEVALPFPAMYAGVNFVLCNSDAYGDVRRKSFISDASGQLIATQRDREPLSVTIKPTPRGNPHG